MKYIQDLGKSYVPIILLHIYIKCNKLYIKPYSDATIVEKHCNYAIIRGILKMYLFSL